MRPLPPEQIHLPFQPGPYRMSMDLTTAPEAAETRNSRRSRCFGDIGSQAFSGFSAYMWPEAPTLGATSYFGSKPARFSASGKFQFA